MGVVLLGPGYEVLCGLLVADLSCHVGHRLKEFDCEPGHGYLLFEAHRPVPVLQIVVLFGRQGLDAGIAAVVVGHEQSAAGNDFAGATSSELDNGVFDGRVVDAVDLVGGKAGAEIPHGLAVDFLKQGQQPHAFIGPGCRQQRQGCGY